MLNRCPHLVYLKVSCFGHVGPLAHGKGFQQNANFATGVASVEDENLLGYQLVSQARAHCHCDCCPSVDVM